MIAKAEKQNTLISEKQDKINHLNLGEPYLP